MVIDILLFVFDVCIFAMVAGLNHIYRSDDKKDPVATLLVINDGEETYLFLDTDKKPEEFTKYKEVVFKVETRK